MNTANLQLEGLYVAVSALMNSLRQKGLLTEAEIEASLADAEERVASDPRRPSELSPSHVDAVLFPLRHLRLANRMWAGSEVPGFGELAARVGREKPQQGHILAAEREDIEASEDADIRRIEAEDRRRGGVL